MAKKRVLFDASPMLDSNKSGVGYFTDHLMNSLQNNYATNLELTGYYFDFLGRNSKKKPQNTNIKFYKIWAVPGKFISLMRMVGIQPFLEIFAPKKADLVIFTNYVSLPLLFKCKTVLIIYDMGYMDVPEYIQSKNLKFLRKFCSKSISNADLIITISEFTKDRIKHHFPKLEAEIMVTSIPPVSNHSDKSNLTSRLFGLGIRPGSYILCVGTIEPRKNIVTVVEAYKRLGSPILSRYSLVIAGGKGWKDEKINKVINESQKAGFNIILTGYVSDEEKSSLYSNASCFVMASHYEGFGMPILEAMQHSLPIAVSDISVFHEVAKNAVVYFNKDDADDVAEKITALLCDKRLSDNLISRYKDVLGETSWKRNAEIVYKTMLG